MSLRLRLALWGGVQTALALLLVALVLFLALRSFLVLGERERLELLRPALERVLSSRTPLEVSELPRSVDIRVVRSGRILDQTHNFPPLPLELPNNLYRPLQGHQVLTVVLNLPGGPAQAQLASDLMGIDGPLRAYLRALMWVLPLSTLGVALLSYAVAGRALRPLSQLERAASELGAGKELRRSLPGVHSKDELGRLARTLQAALAKVADVRERELEFTRAAAHDLRSPLAAMKVRLQGTLGQARSPQDYRLELEELLEDVERMTQLTERLLLLAREEEQLILRPLNLAQLAGDAVDRARGRVPGVWLDFESWGDTHVSGDAVLLGQLLENLLENALKHAPGADLKVCVGLQEGLVRLSVRDTGPGVAPEALERLTEAFWQGDPSRSSGGNGLGLALVGRIAGLHGARLRFENRQPTGLHVLLEFPPLEVEESSRGELRKALTPS